NAPAVEGDWTVVRFGHTFNGAVSHPAPATGAGPECDKLSKEGIEAHFNGMIGKLIEDAGPLAGKAFAATHVDSWEVGGGNWTRKMREEFRRLRGYDMLPFLPALTGRFIDSVDVTERFLWDLRQTCSELLAANYIGHLGKLARDRGLRLSMETYGTPALDMDVVNYVDEPVCEFWWSGGGRLDYSMKSMSSAAHVNGRPIVGAEAFTSNRHEKWRAHPGLIKARGDRAFCQGVSRLIVHRYAMQPWAEGRRPGISMGPYGLHYERTQTWWEDSRAWHRYVARCQYLLRQGTFVADVLSLQPEEPMQRFNLLKLPGYDYDGIGPRAFLDLATVEDGRLALPSGMRYRLLALSRTNTETMTVPMLRKIKRLVEDGAVVLGTAPDATPGLADYPNADKVLKRLAADLWGADPMVKERAVGRGRVFRGMEPEEVLARLGVVPDFGSDERIRWIHRKAGDTDIYFVATCVRQPVDATCTFRVRGRQPELWNPETGTIQAIPYYWTEADGRTSVPLQFAPSGSAFIVFREKAGPSRQVVRVTRKAVLLESRRAPTAPPPSIPAIDLVNGTVSLSGDYEVQMGDGRTYRCEVTVPESMTISGPWELKLAAGWGAPETVRLEKLTSWSHHRDPRIKYYSGSGSYYKRFEITPDFVRLKSARNPRARILLDLGEVAVMAEVKLNGRGLGVLWKAPYRVDVTDAVEAGENVLEVRVVSLWINRMIGDELLPDDSERD
ncbi:MAG: glycosyl hydrolase, partial [Planctomycetota bacterium]